MKGRTPKPTALKALEGNPGHRKMDGGVEPAPPSGTPDPPDHLSEPAKNKWFQIIAIMMKVQGWLTKMDADVLAIYCSAYAQWQEAEIELPRLQKKHRKARGKEKGRIWGEICALTGQRRQAMKDLKAYGTEFGWSSTSRTRIRINAGQGELDFTGTEEKPSDKETAFDKTLRLAR